MAGGPCYAGLLESSGRPLRAGALPPDTRRSRNPRGIPKDGCDTAMTRALTLAATTALALSLAPAALHASEDSDNAAKAALVILGVAAMAHAADHHYDGQHKNDANYEAAYERGYRDGLYNEPYDSRHSSEAYGNGYSSGMKERENQLAHKRHTDDARSAPNIAMRACVGEASAKWDRNPRDISVIKSRKLMSNDFMVEVAVGHKHGACEVSADGKVFQFQNGTI